MKYTFLFVVLTLMTTRLSGQFMLPYNEDSLKIVLQGKKDTVAVDILLKLAGSYYFKDPTASLSFSMTALDSSRKLNFERGVIRSLVHAAEAMRSLGNFVETLKMQRDALDLSKKIGDRDLEASTTGYIGIAYFELRHYEEALPILKKAVALRRLLGSDSLGRLYRVYIARAYIETKKYDSAYYFLKAVAPKTWKVNGPGVEMLTMYALGDYYFHVGNTDSAYYFWMKSLKISRSQKVVPNSVTLTSAKLSGLFNLWDQLDSSMYYGLIGFKIARSRKLNPRILSTSALLANLHRKKGNADSALYYFEIASAANDSIFGPDKTNELELLQLEEQRRNLEIQQAEERYQNNIRLIGLVSITAIILVASLLLFRSNRIKQKTNLVLQQTLNELKATQSQLIQSEKMASLGELTAGIAHEIQNPLNFVNNFSEVNDELIDDLKKEVVSGNKESLLEIANAIKTNQEKINHHGKRADGIVKSMLQHSRSSSGQNELTDINALCDEYVRLAYHGYRAKDKSFNTIPINIVMETHFDPSLPKIKVIQQDIGRVLLNLINNAFYAANEKAKHINIEYEPAVTVTTKFVNGKIEIAVKDNGNGIKDSTKAKIFQPFFTTKPAGQGTGLGLSLSYDIIKAHGGTIVVNSKEGEGAEFIIQLTT